MKESPDNFAGCRRRKHDSVACMKIVPKVEGCPVRLFPAMSIRFLIVVLLALDAPKIGVLPARARVGEDPVEIPLRPHVGEAEEEVRGIVVRRKRDGAPQGHHGRVGLVRPGLLVYGILPEGRRAAVGSSPFRPSTQRSSQTRNAGLDDAIPLGLKTVSSEFSLRSAGYWLTSAATPICFMRFRRTLEEPEEPIELNLIPLIDIIMFLLIFFVSTTSFIEEPGVQVAKPTAASASLLDKNSIIFAITPEGKVAYGGKEVGLGGVRPSLREC